MNLRVSQDLNAALMECMEADERVCIIGEDVLDPYGGAFRITAGLSTKFPERVYTAPISEAAIIGVATGAALRGLLPVAEIMFGDFVTLAADQLINHAAKFPGMYNGQVQVPLVVRTPMGGGRGYGPTHSQSLAKHFLGVPGLRVVAPSHFSSPGQLLKQAILADPMPTLFIENKLLYPLTVQAQGTPVIHIQIVDPAEIYPTVQVRNYPDSAIQPDITVLTYGGISRLLEPALEQLADEEIWVEAFLPSDLNAGIGAAIEQSCRKTRRVLLIEEDVPGAGWCAEQVSQIAQHMAPPVNLEIEIMQAANSIIPAAQGMESEMLPAISDIVDTIIRIISS